MQPNGQQPVSATGTTITKAIITGGKDGCWAGAVYSQRHNSGQWFRQANARHTAAPAAPAATGRTRRNGRGAGGKWRRSETGTGPPSAAGRCRRCRGTGGGTIGASEQTGTTAVITAASNRSRNASPRASLSPERHRLRVNNLTRVQTCL